MMGGRRSSIYQAMRDLVASISSPYQQAAKDKVAEQKQRVRADDRSTQTSLQQQTSCASNRQRDELDKQGGTDRKYDELGWV